MKCVQGCFALSDGTDIGSKRLRTDPYPPDADNADAGRPPYPIPLHLTKVHLPGIT